jgi:FixJ family two-component response regulator
MQNLPQAARLATARLPTDEEEPTVFVIDDDESVRDALDSLFRAAGLKAQCFRSTGEFRRQARVAGPACLVLDVRMPEQSGLEFQDELAAQAVDIPVVFITGHGNIPMSVHAMKTGAIEFLTKPFNYRDLLEATRRGLDQDAARRKKASALDKVRDRFQALTLRQREVMGFVVRGFLNKQTAAHLNISEIAVKVHRRKVMRKMGAESLVDLVRIADSLSPHAES